MSKTTIIHMKPGWKNLTLYYVEGRTLNGKIRHFHPDALLMVRTEEDEDLVIPPETIAFVGFKEPDIVPDKPPSERLKQMKIHFVNGRVLNVLVEIKKLEEQPGCFVYPVTEGGLFAGYYFYHHAVSAYEEIEPIGNMLAREHGELEKEIQKALEVQEEVRDKKVGDYLTGKHLVDAKVLEKALREQGIQTKGKQRVRLGEVLVEAGLATKQEIDEALRAQKRDRNKRLGEILVEMGVVTEDELMQVLAAKFHIDYIDLDTVELDPNWDEYLPREMCLKYQILPVRAEGDSIIIAIADPLAFEAVDMLRFFTQKKIKQVLVAPSKLNKILENFKDEDTPEAQATLNELLQELMETRPEDEEEEEEDTPVVDISSGASGVVKVVNYILLEAIRMGASDIHIEPNGKERNLVIRLRIDGRCSVVWRLPPTVRNQLVSRLKIMANLDISEKRKPQDGKIRLKTRDGKIDLRVATIPVASGDEDVVIRVLSSGKPLPLEVVGLQGEDKERMLGLLEHTYGIILVVGPTGSGKTTTLHSLLHLLNTEDRKIWTAEDPVEIVQPGLRQVQINNKVGLTFASALRSFLRSDPDIIMVGEMRDHETVEIAIQASLTGHLVLSTLHTNSAAETLSRLLEMGVEAFTFSDALLGVVAQRLVRRLCDHCKQKVKATTDEFDYVKSVAGEDVLAEYVDNNGDLWLYKPKGCNKCRNTGYKGRIGVFEVLVADEQIKRAVRQNKSAQEIKQMAIEGGMHTLKEDGVIKVLQGVTDLLELGAVVGT